MFRLIFMNRVMKWLSSLTRRFVPNLDTLHEAEQQYAVLTVAITLYGLPVAIGGLVWLVLATDLTVIQTHWLPLLLLLALSTLFRLFSFFITVEIGPGVYAKAYTSLDILVWSASLIFGPTALWIDLAGNLVQFVRQWPPESQPNERMSHLRSLTDMIAVGTVPRLVALHLYITWGGTIPLPNWAVGAILPAFYATFVQLFLGLLFNAPLLVLFATITTKAVEGASPLRVLLQIFKLWFGTNILLDPVAVLIAGLYGKSGPEVYFFFVASVLVGSLVGSRLSTTVERNRRRSRELEQLEQLGRAIIAAPPDGSALSELLSQHLPGMFSYSRVEVHLFPDQTLARKPEEWEGTDPAVWDWLVTHPGAHVHQPGEAVPWGSAVIIRPTLVIPILDIDGAEPVGGLYVSLSPGEGSIEDMLPAAQSLGAQIASALHSAAVYRETLAHQRTQQELAVAGRIQASFLPHEVPELQGWQLSATLEPARETSGDFYDLIPMWDGRLAIVVADVADKGLGAALYMALSRTLIRTYATEYSTRYPENYAYHPERVLNTVNQCILQDTSSDLFVTVFYGIIDPGTATLTYANAGHNPPFLISFDEGRPDQPTVRTLDRTGIPLGIFSDISWERGSTQLLPGDVLVLYTDGVTEAENVRKEYFGETRLLETARVCLEQPANSLRQTLVDGIHEFARDAPQVDDITLLVVKRVH